MRHCGEARLGRGRGNVIQTSPFEHYFLDHLRSKLCAWVLDMEHQYVLALDPLAVRGAGVLNAKLTFGGTTVRNSGQDVVVRMVQTCT